MDNDFLQGIKLEISRTVTLNAYERIAFHKILAVEKSENGAGILYATLINQMQLEKAPSLF
jgi:hypothetical protein